MWPRIYSKCLSQLFLENYNYIEPYWLSLIPNLIVQLCWNGACFEAPNGYKGLICTGDCSYISRGSFTRIDGNIWVILYSPGKQFVEINYEYRYRMKPISVTFALRWLQPLDEPTCVQRRVAILWSLEHEQNLANGVSVYPHRRCETHSRIRSNILLQAANISEKNWKHTCLGKPTHQPLRTIEEWTYLLTRI